MELTQEFPPHRFRQSSSTEIRMDGRAAGGTAERRLAVDHVLQGDIRGEGNDRSRIRANQPAARDRDIPRRVKCPPMGVPVPPQLQFAAKQGGKKARQIVERGFVQFGCYCLKWRGGRLGSAID
ncbi:MAG: hypothetical protein ACLPX7_17635 [Xanthobacteraceae bacterium]